MSKALDWRSPDFAEQFKRHDFADFAQEFLRRNQNYRREYNETLSRISEHGVDAQEEMEVLARRWGMIFPL